MARTAVIDSNEVVTNVINAPDGFVVEGFTLVATEVAQTGYVYDSTHGTFAPPIVVPPEPTYPDVSQNVFIALAMAVGGLTNAKLAAIAADTSTDVRAFWLMFSLAISISKPGTNGAAGATTTAGLATLVTATYLTQAGSDAIVANWPTS